MEIGEKLKNLRLKRGLTQEELADRCGLTKGYISQLENDLTLPSIPTLGDILSAAGSDFKTFFGDEEERVVFTEKDFFVKETPEQKIVWLVPNCQKNAMEPIYTEIYARASLPDDMPHEGEEFGFVLEGEIEITSGSSSFVCRENESFYITGDRVHRLTNRTDRTARLIWVSSPPAF